jgi:arylsulfatase A-like enzyme
METDWEIGQVLQSLDTQGLAGNTLVIFTSDNGCAPYIGVKQLEALGHFPSAQLRGYKSDIWEGGHRIPFFVRWPGKVVPRSTSDQTICLSDLMATLAQVTGITLPANAAEDSFSILPILLGAQHGPLRYAEVHHSIFGNFAIRQGQWKLELCSGSGGWDSPTEQAARAEGLPVVQLYDMNTDESETHNVQAQHPDIVKRLTGLLEESIADGRTTPGPVETNDVPINLWKLPAKQSVTTRPAIGND